MSASERPIRVVLRCTRRGATARTGLGARVPVQPMAVLGLGAALTVVTALAVLITLGGCEHFSDTYSLRVTLPGLPAHWDDPEEISAYELRWIQYGAERRKRVVLTGGALNGENGLETRRSQVRITLPKRPNVALLAYPLTRDGVLLQPAGTIAPLRLRSSGRLPLRFEDGPAAYLLYRLDRDGRGGARVNAARLLREIEQRLGALRWWMDWIAVLDAFERGVFRVTMLRPVRQHRVAVCLPPGEYRSADVLAPPRAVPESGCVPDALLAEGVHRWFSADGHLTVTLEVTHDGRVARVVALRDR